MGKVARYTEHLINQYVSKGYWTYDLTVDFWERNAKSHPREEALVDSRSRFTWEEAVAAINRLASFFVRIGLEKDDILILQLYNSATLTLCRLAAEKAGVLLLVLPYTFRTREIEAILRSVSVRGVIIPYEFRGHNYYEMYRGLERKSLKFDYLFVVGEKVPDGTISLDEIIFSSGSPVGQDILGSRKFGPFEFQEIMTTSGTTGVPKLVEWTGCARLYQARCYIEGLCLTRNDVIAAFAPSIGGATECVAHRAAPQVAAKIVMLERFDPRQACELIERERVTVACCVPTMVIRLIEYQDLKKHNLSSLRVLLSSTALLPYSVAKMAETELGCAVCQGYGSVDSGAITMSRLDDPPEARWSTVGKPFPGVDVRLVDPNGNNVPHGEVGRVIVRGPTSVGGYYKDEEETRKAWQNGYFMMGDLALFDNEGRLKLVGRESDVIIRGGQNIYPKEIEDLLIQHEKVADVAVVRMPDKELGEKACAFVVLRAGATLTFEEMVAYLKEKGVAVFKIPERLEIIDTLPLTPAGNKVNRRALEDLITKKLLTDQKIDET